MAGDEVGEGARADVGVDDAGGAVDEEVSGGGGGGGGDAVAEGVAKESREECAVGKEEEVGEGEVGGEHVEAG